MPALYLHIPFCRRKCPYCDFFSLEEHRSLLDSYPDLLIRHLELAKQEGSWKGPFSTVFFGGGTPSLLPAGDVGRILAAVRSRFGVSEEAEISMEANPGTLTPESLAGYRRAGINRLSLGVQSMEDDDLQRLGRIHSAQDARQAAHWAHRAGFVNLSVDLMFALPGQTPADLEHQIDRLLELGPQHLSCYGLGVEEGTPFYHLHRGGGLDLPDEERYAELFFAVHERLTGAGFEHYEISNYARPGYRCRHNERYWQRRGYLGVGAGAHSFCGREWGSRFAVPHDLERYGRLLDRGEDPAVLLETFDRRGAMAETLYLGLRTAAGVEEEGFRSRFGSGVAESFSRALGKAGRHIVLREGRWRMDPSGWLLYDHLIAPFL